MRLTLTAVLAALTLASPAALGMVLNPRGTGQVLIYPYYTVNKQQQTLVSVTNTTYQGKVLKVRFREAYNGREVLEFNIFLSAHDTWTGTLFSLSDAGLPGTGAAILVVDKSCTGPNIATVSPKLPDGRTYQPFLDYAYTGANSDTGPIDDARTREGYFEIIEMAEVTGNTLTAITPVDGAPANCAALLSDPPSADLTAPGGGVMGTEAIVNVAQGTFFSANAYAIDGFAKQVLYSPTASLFPDLNNADVSTHGFVTAYVPIGGSYVQLDYPPSQAIDAVSALLMGDQIFGEWDNSPSEGAQTDWVITFPTKHYYVDGDALAGSGQPQSVPPFLFLFGERASGNSFGRSNVSFGSYVFNREGTEIASDPPPPCGFNECPNYYPPVLFGLETQVVTFPRNGNGEILGALGSTIETAVLPDFTVDGAGTANLDTVTADGHQLRPDAHGTILRGLPVIGFSVVDYINANVTPGVLANYSGANPLRTSLACGSVLTNSGVSGPCDSK